MKQVKQTTRGFTPTVPHAESVEEFDKVAGQSGACLAFANDEATYRSTLPKAWKLVFQRGAEQFGVKRKVVGKKELADGTKKDILESDKLYVERLIAKAPREELAALLQSCIDEVGLDVSKTGRTKKPAKIFYDSAAGCLAKVEAGEGTWEKFEASCHAQGATTSVGFNEDGTVDIDSVAQILQEVFQASTPAF